MIKYAECLGSIYKLKNGKFEAGPLLTGDPIRVFDNPHDAEQYLRDVSGTHPVLETKVIPLKQISGNDWPLGACGVWIEE